MDADEWDDCLSSMEDGLWLATLAGRGGVSGCQAGIPQGTRSETILRWRWRSTKAWSAVSAPPSAPGRGHQAHLKVSPPSGADGTQTGDG